MASSADFVQGGETVLLKFQSRKPNEKKLVFSLKVVYEDDYIAAIYKPAGILVSGNSFKTITNALEQNLKPSSQKDSTKPQPVHRLDFATTGVLLVGKTSSSIRELNQLFKLKEIQKTYYAVCIGSIEKSGSIIDRIDGKNAHSNYKLLERVNSSRFNHLNLVKLQPQTGRRHQLRKHLASIGNPILGDKDYGTEPLILKGKGLYLHAYSLEFNHPITQEKLKLIANLPERFIKVFPNITELL